MPWTTLLYGQQERPIFHGNYDCYCYPPLYVFCGQQLLCVYMRGKRNRNDRQSRGSCPLLGNMSFLSFRT